MIDTKADKDKRRAATTDQSSTTPINLTTAFFKGVRHYVVSEDCGVELGTTINNAARESLGERIAPGLFVSHLSGKAELHLHDVPALSTIANSKAAQDALLESISENHLLNANTPSKHALRIMLLFLKRLPNISPEDQKILKELGKEAKAIDLDDPKDKDWSKTIRITIADKPIEITLSLKKASALTRASRTAIGKDIPQEYRGHEYSFNAAIKPVEQRVTEGLRKTQQLYKQVTSLTGFLAPVVALDLTVSSFLPTRFIPAITENPLAQLGVDIGTAVLPTFLACAAWFALRKRLQKLG